MKQLQVKLYGHWHNVEYWFEGDMNPKNIIEDVRTHETIPAPTDNKPEPPHEHKWLHNKWRTEYLTHCALDALCNPHEFEPKLDTRFKYHVCQKCGIVISDAEKKAESYQCKSYYDNNNQLQDCTCGKCGKPKKIELPTELGTLTDFSQSYGTCTGTLKFVGPTTQMKKWMASVTNWINSQNKGE